MHDPNENRPGYKKTKVGWIPVEWSNSVLSDIVSKSRPICYGVVQTGEHDPNGIACVRVTDLVDGCLDPEKMVKTSTEVSRKYRRTILQKGDVMIALRGDAGKSARVPDSLIGSNLTRGVGLISSNDKFDERYLELALNGPNLRLYFKRSVNGTALQEIPISTLKKTPISLPPLPEQQKIAEILTTWDNAIDRLRKLIDAKKRQKKGLMQQLLTGKKRLPEFEQGQEKIQTILGVWPSDWPLADLLEVFSKVKRKNTNGLNRVLTASGENGLIDQQSYFNKSVAGADLSTYYHLKKGEFAYNRSSMGGYPYGAIKRLDLYNDGVLSILYACFALRPNAGDSDYYNQLFESGLLNSQLRRLVQVGGRAHGLLNITDGDFFGLKIPRPSLEEQTAIAKVLDAADREIRTLESKLAALESQKKGLMQRLLTGQIRVNV